MSQIWNFSFLVNGDCSNYCNCLQSVCHNFLILSFLVCSSYVNLLLSTATHCCCCCKDFFLTFFCYSTSWLLAKAGRAHIHRKHYHRHAMKNLWNTHEWNVKFSWAMKFYNPHFSWIIHRYFMALPLVMTVAKRSNKI